MKAFELLAKLRLLILSGKEDGELEWIGKDSKWKELEREEEAILRDKELQHG